ncbi:MAG: hypothetical protein Tsb0032_15480 [Kiloniellaceae bacterium]
MTRKMILNGTSKFALAAVVATGLTASPFALTAGADLQSNSAAAQVGGSSGQAEEFVNDGAGTTTDVSTNVYRILGTTADAANEAVTERTTSAAGPLADYEDAMRDGNLDSAANVLAAVSKRPITEKLVLDVNNTLGVDSTLTAEQVADAAAERQDPEIRAMVPAMGENPYDAAKLDTSGRNFEAYEAAMTSGNLDAAADALAKATERPITEDLVLRVNHDLGVESTLTAKQVAIAAAKQQKMQK